MIYTVFVRECTEMGSSDHDDNVFTFTRESDAHSCIHNFHHHWYDDSDNECIPFISYFVIGDMNKHDDVSQLIWDIVDVQDTWDDAIKAINDILMKKAVEKGIYKDVYDKMKF